MIKKTITFVDYEGNERTEDFWFNLNKAEIMEMELLTEGGIEKMIKNIVSSQDLPSLVSLFKKIILKSYGEKSPDGRRFIKNDELTESFTQTEAYSQLFMELATDSDAASAFINGIIPDDIEVDSEEIQKRLIDTPEKKDE